MKIWWYFPNLRYWEINSNRLEGILKSFHRFTISSFMYPGESDYESVVCLSIEISNRPEGTPK